jgi:hypothetical protein
MVAKGSLRDTVVRHVQEHDSQIALFMGVLLGHVLDREQAGLLMLASFPFFPDPVALAAEAAGVLAKCQTTSAAGAEGNVESGSDGAAAGSQGEAAEAAVQLEVKKEVSEGGGGRGGVKKTSGGGRKPATERREGLRPARSTRSRKAIIESSESPNDPHTNGSADTNGNSSEATV